jgi:hypothetical protein
MSEAFFEGKWSIRDPAEAGPVKKNVEEGAI